MAHAEKIIRECDHCGGKRPCTMMVQKYGPEPDDVNWTTWCDVCNCLVDED